MSPNQPLVVVQRIETHWTRATRDAAGREVRARLPRAYPLPASLLNAQVRCVRHLVTRFEPDYAPRMDVECGESLSTGRGIGGAGISSVQLLHVDQDLEVTFLATDAGMPHRPRTVMR